MYLGIRCYQTNETEITYASFLHLIKLLSLVNLLLLRKVYLYFSRKEEFIACVLFLPFILFLGAVESSRASSRSRRKGNPRKVNVELLEHSTIDNINEIDNIIPVVSHSIQDDENIYIDIPHSPKRRRAASKQAKSSSSRLRCDFCCITFQNEFYYDLHMSSHDPEEEIFLDSVADDGEVWQVAEEDFNAQMGYQDDSDDETKSIEPDKVHRNIPQACEICDKTFIYKKSFRKHKLDCHADTTCTNCWKTFTDTQKLSDHTCHIPEKTVKVKPKKINETLNRANNSDKVIALNSFRCNVCEKTFKSASDLRKHAVCHSDETPFPCTKCDKKFKRKKNLNSHLERCIGPHKVQLTCSRCPKTFWTKGYLRMHERIHDGTNPYYCKPCDKYFLKKSKLQRHLDSDERRKLRAELANASKKEEYKCSFCEKVFLDKRNHGMHERIHKGTNPHYCKECDHYFLKRGHLIHHQKSIHSNETPYSCVKCDKRFKFSESLDSHMRCHEREASGVGKFQCITCGELFTGLLNLKEHLNLSVTCVSLECEICNQKFLRKKQLTRHMVVHTKQKPFLCGECKRAFAFKWELTKHERIHSKDKQFPCNQCEETFIQKSDLNDHIIWHETGKYPKECPTCGRHFKKQSKLDIHIKGVHENRRDHQCETCGKDFKRKHDLKRHEEFHNVECENEADVLTCMICKQKGFSEETLETHQLSHMRVESMEVGDSKPLSLEMLSQFNPSIRKGENVNKDGDVEFMQGAKDMDDTNFVQDAKAFVQIPIVKPDPESTQETVEHTTSQHATTQHSTIQHTTTEHAVSQGVIAQKATTLRAISHDVTSQHITTQNATAQHSITQNAISQDAVAQHVPEQHVTEQHDTAHAKRQHITPHHNISSQNATQHTTLDNTTPQHTTTPHIEIQNTTRQTNTLRHTTTQHTETLRPTPPHATQHTSPQHITLQCTDPQNSTTHNNTTHAKTQYVSQHTTTYQMEEGKSAPSPPVQPPDFCQSFESDAGNIAENSSVAEMSSFKPLPLETSKAQQIPVLISTVSQSFSDILHDDTDEPNMIFSSNAIQSLQPNQRLPPPDTFLVENTRSNSPNKQFSSDADLPEKNLEFMSSYSPFESFTSLVNNYHPNTYLSTIQNNISNIARIAQPNLLNTPHHSSLFTGLHPPSQNTNDLPHNVDKLLMHEANYSN